MNISNINFKTRQQVIKVLISIASLLILTAMIGCKKEELIKTNIVFDVTITDIKIEGIYNSLDIENNTNDERILILEKVNTTLNDASYYTAEYNDFCMGSSLTEITLKTDNHETIRIINTCKSYNENMQNITVLYLDGDFIGYSDNSLFYQILKDCDFEE